MTKDVTRTPAMKAVDVEAYARRSLYGSVIERHGFSISRTPFVAKRRDREL
jgi:hypothetical protein